MEPLIADSISRLLLKFEKAADSGKSVDVLEYFGRYTMEVILASAFGRHKDIQSTEERDKLTDAIDAVFGCARKNSMLDSAVLYILLKWLCECACTRFCATTRLASLIHIPAAQVLVKYSLTSDAVLWCHCCLIIT